jgi:hypothetical protein
MPLFRPTKTDADQLKLVRKLTTEAGEVLKRPCPDSFAGRKTQEPFPREDEAARIEDWLNSKELEPPK